VPTHARGGRSKRGITAAGRNALSRPDLREGVYAEPHTEGVTAASKHGSSGPRPSQYVDAEPSALVFTIESGPPIRRGSFNKLFGWTEVVAQLGFKGLHFHDLRHTGNTLAASSKVSTRDLMARMGHDSIEAALIYQHKSSEADRSIADHMDAQARRAKKPKKRARKPPSDDDDDGSAGVPARTG
jgi:hypothetical protein